MNECVIITKENLQKAYDNSCEEVQDILLALFPDEDLGKEDKPEFCCKNFEMYYRGASGHKKFIFDGVLGGYALPDAGGWLVRYCPTLLAFPAISFSIINFNVA